MSEFVETGTILDRILARTADDVAARKARTSTATLERMAASRGPRLSLLEALTRPTVAVISEIKRASPSRGVFPVVVDPPVVAAQYLDGGAAALSVLTDEPFFQGTLADMGAAAAVAHARPKPAPVLRKDFVLDEFQLLEAVAHDADAALLIVGALSQARLVALQRFADDLGLSTLVEVHSEEEMRRAADAGSRVIGINNRDLHTFVVDLAVTERVAPLAPAGAALVGESGIFTTADVERLAAVGVSAILVGESLIVAPDRAAAVRALAGVPSRRPA
jgi:indole-3-glycerol phosphate synthase